MPDPTALLPVQGYREDPPPHGWVCPSCGTSSRGTYPRPKAKALAEDHADTHDHPVTEVQVVPADLWLAARTG